jgi:hypothetical protein
LVIIAIAAVLFMFETPDGPWGPYVKELQAFWRDLKGEPRAGVETDLARRKEIEKGEFSGGVYPRNQSRAKSTNPEPTKKDLADVDSVKLDISIGMGFRPVGFEIAAVPQVVELSQTPYQRLRRLPQFASRQQRYGVIKLASGRELGFVVDLAASGYQMYLDLNRNGDLSDDGPPLDNQGKTLFASRLNLPLEAVTGIHGLEGEYRLWIYTNQGNWERERMLYYCMTQLRGELLLKGKRYTVFLADNGPVDGDYRNDGINIDLDSNGEIDRRSEFFPQGQPVVIDGVSYLFHVVR